MQHQGLAFLLGIDSDRDIYYSVRRIPPPADRAAAGEEEDAMSDAAIAVSSPYSQWQDWLRLPLPADTADDSVVEQERQAGTDGWVRSRYDTARRTALAPIQAQETGDGKKGTYHGIFRDGNLPLALAHRARLRRSDSGPDPSDNSGHLMARYP